MSASENKPLNISEVCQATKIPTKRIIKIVEYCIIEQIDPEPRNWEFNSEMIPTIHKALRLRRDLNLNWSGVALAMELIEENENIRQENKRLKQRLSRYIDAA